MTDDDIDRRLGDLLRASEPVPDPAFADRVLVTARLDSHLAAARRRSWRKAAIDCATAAAMGLTFFLMTQTEAPAADGIIALEGPAMAALVMLLLWGVVALPARGRGTTRLTP